MPGSGAVRGDALSAKPPATRSVGAPCGAPTCAAVPHAHHAATPSSTCHHFHPRHLASSPGDHARHAAQARVPIPARVHTRWCSGSGGMSTRPTPRVGVNHAVVLSVYRPRASTRRRCAVAPPLCERWSRARCRGTGRDPHHHALDRPWAQSRTTKTAFLLPTTPHSRRLQHPWRIATTSSPRSCVRASQAELSADGVYIGAHLVVLHLQLLHLGQVLRTKHHPHIRAFPAARVLGLLPLADFRLGDALCKLKRLCTAVPQVNAAPPLRGWCTLPLTRSRDDFSFTTGFGGGFGFRRSRSI